MTYQLDLGDDAKADIRDILEWSVAHFGVPVRDGYQALIRAAFVCIAEDPELPGSHNRDTLRPGLRTLHLRTCRDEVSPTVRRIANPPSLRCVSASWRGHRGDSSAARRDGHLHSAHPRVDRDRITPKSPQQRIRGSQRHPQARQNQGNTPFVSLHTEEVISSSLVSPTSKTP